VITLRTRVATTSAVQWDGTNTDAVAALGATVLGARGVRLWVLTESGPAEVHPGWWVARAGDGEVTVLSAEVHARFWEPAP
jgi:hypothetical protein